LTEIVNLLREYSPICLKEMGNVKLMDRTDTKFIFHTEKLPGLLEKAKKIYRVLNIDNKMILNYRSLYFDTNEFFMYHSHHNGKQNRYKVRLREYVDTKKSYLEVKFKSNKGRTRKTRTKKKNIQTSLSDKSKKFIQEISPIDADKLIPKLWVNFSRITLVHKNKNERLTIDLNLKYNNVDNNNPFELSFLTIVEAKREKFSGTSDFINLLKDEKLHPTGFSKYCIGTILLNKYIKYNRFKEKLLTLKKINHDNGNFDFFIRSD